MHTINSEAQATEKTPLLLPQTSSESHVPPAAAPRSGLRSSFAPPVARTYYALSHVGPVSLRLALDTGSADLWVGAENCQSESGGDCVRALSFDEKPPGSRG